MADSTAVLVKGLASSNGINLVAMTFTKANATDVVNVPAGYGSKVVMAIMQAEATGVPDPATAISSLAVTGSVGTGAMRGLFWVV